MIAVSESRHVTDEEYQLFYSLTDSPWYLQLLMEIGYLCRMRPTDARRLRRGDILDAGIDTRRLKVAGMPTTKWSPRLREAVRTCLKY